MSELTESAYLFLLIACVILPYAAIKTARVAGADPGALSFGSIVTSALITHFLLLGLAALAAWQEDIVLFPPYRPAARDALLVLGFLAVYGTMVPLRWKSKTAAEKQSILRIVPHRPSELAPWALLSLSAGIAEEAVYRGLMLELWRRLVGEWWIAAAICIAVFSLSHFIQGWRAMAVVAVGALSLHLIVLAAGSLYPAMAAHFLYDLFAGFATFRLAQQEGLSRDPADASPAGSQGERA